MTKSIEELLKDQNMKETSTAQQVEGYTTNTVIELLKKSLNLS